MILFISVQKNFKPLFNYSLSLILPTASVVIMYMYLHIIMYLLGFVDSEDKKLLCPA